MQAAPLLARFRASALYLLFTVLLLSAAGRALVIAGPQVLAADRFQSELEPLDRRAYEESMLQPNGQTQFDKAVYRTHRQYDGLRQQANGALLPVFGYVACLLAALLVYVRTETQQGAVIVCLSVAVIMYAGLQAVIHWASITGAGLASWQWLTLALAPRHTGNQVLLVSLLAGVALCYDMLRGRKKVGVPEMGS